MEKKGICGICSAGCWIIAEYDKRGRIKKIRAEEGSPMGMICRLGEHAEEIIYSKDRLTYPMKRVGEKGSYQFERITWDQAYDEMVENLTSIKDKYGAEANAIYTGVGCFELSFCDIFQPRGVAVSSASSVLFPFGSPNTMGVGALCYVSFGMIAPHVTMGRMFMDTFSDIENSELIVIWGTNPATDLPPVDMKRILHSQKKGAQVVVIDPRRTAAAKMTGGKWIPIRPGTDGALALGMINVVVEEELYDDDFVQKWTVGFDGLVKYVQHYRPQIVEQITGIPKEDIIYLARKIASAKGVSQLMYTGMEYSNSGVQNIRAALILWALTENLDVPGGLCFSMDKNKFPINKEGLVQNPDTGPRLGKDRFPIYIKYRDEAHAIALPDSVLKGVPYKIRSLIIQGSSITTSWPNPGIWKKTLNGLDFLVTIDRQLTADSAYADLVLPATTYFENISYMTYGSLFRIRERMIEPLGEARSDVAILSGLAKRLGYGHLYPQDEEELLESALKGSGFTLQQVREAGGTVSIDSEMMQYKKWEKGQLRKDGEPGFDTPSTKFEIASSILDEYGYDSLPKYAEPSEGPVSKPRLAKKYPLVFNSGSRVNTSFHTQHHNIKGLYEHRPEPTVMINDKDAKERGIENGERAVIKTPRGKVVLRAIVTGDIKQGCIDANHACGGPLGPEEWRSSNINDLTDLKNYDPISGFPVYKSLLCEVSKINEGSGTLVLDTGEIKSDELKVQDAQDSKNIYLDNNATTSIADEVREYMEGIFEIYGNPSSIHNEGKKASRIIEHARRQIAQQLKCTSRRIIFTGSGTESNNIAVKGVALASGKEKNHIITSSVEHPAVLNCCKWLESQGFRVTYLAVDTKGRLDPDDVKRSIGKKTCLVSIMLVNNITGNIQPIKEISNITKQNNVVLHSDAVQAAGKIDIDVNDLGADLLTISAHKLYGPKGVGALYIKKGTRLENLIHGGGQEYGIRSATENILGIGGFGKAAEMIPRYLRCMGEVKRLRDKLESGIKDIAKCFINADTSRRVANTSNITLHKLRGESIVLEAAKRGLCFSSGSACHSGSPDPSQALLAMGLSEEEAHCSLRFSLSYKTSEQEIDETIQAIKEIIEMSKNSIRFIPCK